MRIIRKFKMINKKMSIIILKYTTSRLRIGKEVHNGNISKLEISLKYIMTNLSLLIWSYFIHLDKRVFFTWKPRVQMEKLISNSEMQTKKFRSSLIMIILLQFKVKSNVKSLMLYCTNLKVKLELIIRPFSHLILIVQSSEV